MTALSGAAWMRWVEGELRQLTNRSRGGGGINGPVPTGAIVGWYSTTPPAGWLRCNGASFSSGTYPRLAAVLGGTTTPNITPPSGMAAYIIRT